MPTQHVLNETIRLIEQYQLTRQDVKYIQTMLLVYNNKKKRNVGVSGGLADIRP